MKKSRFLENKRVKYGSFAVGFTIVFLAALIILNVIITSLGNAFGWYVDLTSSRLYSLSDEAEELLDELCEKYPDAKFNIVFPQERDTYISYVGSAGKLIVETAEQMQAKHQDNISVQYVDTLKHKELIKSSWTKTEYEQISLSDVIIEIEGGAQAIKYAYTAFYVTSDNTYIGYNAEKRFISAMTSLCQSDSEKPIVYILKGHGEPGIDQLKEDTVWVEVFENAGFYVEELNLAEAGTIPDERGALIFINSPVTDLISRKKGDSASVVDEVYLLQQFLKGAYSKNNSLCNIIFALSEDTSINIANDTMPNFEELLSAMGIEVMSKGCVTDLSHSISGSNGLELAVDLSRNKTEVESGEIASRFLKDIVASNSTIIVDKGIALTEGTAGVVGATSYSSNISTFLHSYDTATYNDAEGVTNKGSVSLMMLSSYIYGIGEDYSYFVALGTSHFLDNDYANSTANSAVIYAVLERIFTENIVIDLNYKSFETEALTVESSQADFCTVLFTVVIPVIIFSAGFVVWLRRRHS